jgi:cysteine-rich repeat protein
MTGLVIGETYIIRHVSLSGTIESLGVSILFTPAPANPAPNLITGTATDDTSTLTWDNGGVDDPNLECRLTASLDDFNLDPLATIAKDSGWVPCPDSASTYNHTFNGLTYGETYYYHVQSRDGGGGLSAYSNVIDLTQPSSGGGGGGGGGIGGTTGTCGNGIVENLEECDDGNRQNGDGCNAFCNLEEPVCGNGTVEGDEECDDGNTTSGDGCSASCLIEEPAPEPEPEPECGNGILEIGEGCDDGNLIDGDGCSSTCSVETDEPDCGNGILEADEECDDGNNINGDGCSFICEIEHAAAPEAPEPAPLPEPEPVCGNGIVEEPEECDDGNTINDDGCSENCQIEEIVELTLEIRGAPEYRKSNLPEDQQQTRAPEEQRFTDAISQLGSADFFRINNTPNYGLNAQLDIFKPSINNLDVLGVTLDNWGYSEVPVTMVAGTYDFGLNGEAHNTRVIESITIDETTDRIVLDFTRGETTELTAGDTRDDNFVNALDIATMLGSYKATGANLNDLNKDESPIVNAIDIAILIWNYKAIGETY